MNEKDKININVALIFFRTNGISHARTHIDHVIAFQDAVGHSSIDQIKEFYSALDETDKGMFEFACMNCLSRDLARDIVTELWIDYVPNSHEIVKKLEKHYESRLSVATKSNVKLVNKVELLEKENSTLRNDLRALTGILNKYK